MCARKISVDLGQTWSKQTDSSFLKTDRARRHWRIWIGSRYLIVLRSYWQLFRHDNGVILSFKACLSKYWYCQQMKRSVGYNSFYNNSVSGRLVTEWGDGVWLTVNKWGRSSISYILHSLICVYFSNLCNIQIANHKIKTAGILFSC